MIRSSFSLSESALRDCRSRIGILAIASCIWVQMTSLGSFAALFVSAILFFTAYGGVLLFRKEPLAWQMAEKVRQMLFKKRKIG